MVKLGGAPGRGQWERETGQEQGKRDGGPFFLRAFDLCIGPSWGIRAGRNLLALPPLE
jgi:hypothetical protein